MISKFLAQLLGQYDPVASTILVGNRRSFPAHTKLGWQLIGRKDDLCVVSKQVETSCPGWKVMFTTLQRPEDARGMQ
jgi:hypothetical protein